MVLTAADRRIITASYSSSARTARPLRTAATARSAAISISVPDTGMASAHDLRRPSPLILQEPSAAPTVAAPAPVVPHTLKWEAAVAADPSLQLARLAAHADMVLDRLHDRSLAAPRHDFPYFAAMKHHLVKVTRRQVHAAVSGMVDRMQDDPALRTVVASPHFMGWLQAPRSPEEILQMEWTPVDAETTPGALHQLRVAVLNLQILQDGWPADL